MFRVVRAALAKGILASVAVLAVAASILTVDFGAVAPPAHAADMSGFQAGNIIDDALFWDGYAMNEVEIQNFLNSKVPNCASGRICLKNYTETTHTIEATPMCSRYDGQANESAARIIARVAQTCGVSPKVLLVTMQKEQGLVTKSSPGPGDFRSAMGAGCPDTAPCDSNYYGFFDQVHYGAYLLKRYTQPPGTGPGTKWTDRFDLRYPVGRTTAILTHPYPPICDTIPVYIQNQATHALYIYTPYTPNQAALNAGYGFGDDCSSYGNRNFYNYYVDWFGSVRGYPVGVYFRDYHAANYSWLGDPTGPMICGSPDSGCVQRFQGGLVAGSYSTSAAGVHNDYVQVWGWYGRELGPLGYPVSERRCDNMLNGCRQEFQGGWIVTFNGTDTYVVMQSIRQTWSDWGREYGPVGLPTTSGLLCDMGGGACRQEFQGGWIVQSSARTAFIPNAVLDVWKSWGREYNILGLPTGSPSADPTTGNYTQTFQGGTITVANGTPALTSATDPWINTTLTSGWLGSATQAKSCTLKNGACYQAFQNGWIVQSPTGVYAVPTAVLQGWGWYGREYGTLGFPTGAPSANPTTGNYTQTFQGGTITVANGTPTIAIR